MSAFVRVQAYAAEHDTELVLSGARGGVRRVFDIVGLERILRLT